MAHRAQNKANGLQNQQQVEGNCTDGRKTASDWQENIVKKVCMGKKCRLAAGATILLLFERIPSSYHAQWYYLFNKEYQYIVWQRKEND